MKRNGHLFDRIASFPNRLAAAKAARRGRRFRSDVAAFQFELETNLLRLHDELRVRAYRPGPYHTFVIRAPKTRLISAAPCRDRVVQHAICRVIEPIPDRTFVADSFACRLGRGTHAALACATQFARRFPCALKCDVEKFFPSIDHEILFGLLARKLKCRDTLALLETVIAASNPQEPVLHYFPGDDLFTPHTRRHSIPIGSLTSQLFANVMLDPMDHFIKETKRRAGYVRDADDFVVFGDTRGELNALLAGLREFLIAFRLVLHGRKCQVMRLRDGIPFLGWQVFPDHRRLRRSTGVRIQRGLRRLAAAYAAGDVDLARVRASIADWLGFLRQGDTLGLQRRLLVDTVLTRPSAERA